MRVFPVQGTTDTLMDRLYHYIEKVDKDWFQNIKPATAEQIDALRTISGIQNIGFDFPPDYYTFLEHMGQSDGGILESAWDGFSEVSIDSIIEYYVDEIDGCQNMNYPEIDPYHLVFLNHWTEAILYFDLKQGKNPPIYYSTELQSQSFENYLFQRAFYVTEPKKYPIGGGLGTSPRQMEILLRQREFNRKDISGEYWKEPWFTDTPGNSIQFLEILLEKLGFQKLWFSDTVNYCGILENMSIMAHGTNGFWISLTGKKKKQVHDIEKQIKKYLKVTDKYRETLPIMH